MFSLIITVISIALVAVLAVASIYYGGSAMSQGTAKANASTLVNHGQQLNGANAMYKNDNGGTDVASVAGLVTGNYLSAEPAVPASVKVTAWTIGTDPVFQSTISSSETCIQVQKQAIGTSASAPLAAYDGTQTFGCYGAASPFTVYYKK